MDSTPAESVDVTLDDGVWHIRLNRPHKRNALTLPMFAALGEALRAGQANPAVRALLLTGAGGDYTAGHDLAAFAHWPQGPDDPIPRFLHALAEVDRPLVIAVQGAAVGIGATSLLHADWVCCTADAKIRFPFVELGIAPEAGSTQLLTMAVGLNRAKRLLLAGEALTGEITHEWGLVSELVSGDALHDAARERARQLAARDPDAWARTKALLRPDGLAQRIDIELDLINRAVMARRIGEMPVGLGGAVRVGFSLETGAVSPGAGLRLANLPREGWKQAISGFLSVDTRFGPFFLALGSTRGGDTSAYLLLGPTW